MIFRKSIIPLTVLSLLGASCNIDNADWESDEVSGIGVSEDGVVLEPVVVDPTPPERVVVHENERFRNVRVITIGEERFQISGEAMVHEANISWTIEDGHHVLEEGHTTASAGGPQWGKFDFTVNASKVRENSTLHLILYETSAKDGSKQHELPLLLY